MNTLIKAAIDHYRTVLSVLVLVILAGIAAFQSIPKEAAPDVNIPIIYVSLHHEGISPSDAERLLVRPIEKEVRVIEGVKEMRSAAYEGGANVLLEFEAGFDADKALTDVREKVDLAKVELPDDSDEPEVNEVNLSLFPIVVVTLSGDVPERTLLRIARSLERELEGIPTVLDVDIAGDRDELVEIIIDPVKVESYGLSVSDISAMISRSNLLVAAGSLDSGQGRFSIKVPGLLEGVQDIMNLPLKVSGDAVVRVGDIASVQRGFKDPDGFARVDGQPALALEVSKRIGSNIIETVEAVHKVVAAERILWPAGIDVRFLQDQSTEVRTMLSDLQNNVLSAIFLVMVLVVAVLGLRTGLLVGIAIPGSFLMGILVISSLGLTVNTVVLFALILSVGMLVDGAIVVTEYADRKMSEGIDKHEAYRQAGSRMAWPVIASTATTLAAFLPLLFWTGVVGEFMKYLPITLIATLCASLLMALIFVPTLGSLFGKAGAAEPEVMKALAASEHGDVTAIPGVTGRYARVLSKALDHPGKILAGAFALLVVAQMAYAAFGKGVEFFPDIEPERALVNVHARGNLSIWEKDSLMREVESRILGLDGISALYARTGRAEQGGQDQAEDQIGTIQMEFTPWDTRPSADDIMAQVRSRTAELAGIEIEVREPDAGPPVGKAIQVQLSSRNPDELTGAIAKVRRGLNEIGGFVDVEDSRPVPGIQWELDVDRAQAAKFGADISAVGSYVKLVTNGLKFTDYRPDDSTEEIDIVARFPDEYRSLDQLDRLTVQTPQGSIPIGNFVTRTAEPKVNELRRVDGQRVMTIKADVPPGVLSDDKTRELKAWMAEKADLPASIRVDFKGEDKEQKESQAFLGKAFGIALFLMAIILVTQFNSFYSALLILVAVVMSTIGVMLGLLVTGQPFGIIMSGIGVIALAGIVVNNNIVLIDTFDRLKQDFPDPREAILHTGAQRLRPVLLTTVTTILGLLPMVFGLNIDFVTRDISVGAPSTQWWTQLATAIAFGLAFATILTLIVTPCALMLRANVQSWRRRRKGLEPLEPTRVEEKMAAE